jgi:5-methylcytosine-specific restriction endonuclease McrA
MAPQSTALRRRIKQAHGVAASVLRTKPSENPVEGNVTWATREPPERGAKGKQPRMSMVFVLDAERRSLAPCHPARARRLLTTGKAAVWRRYPFTIRLRRALPAVTPPLVRLKIDPGSKTTGLALVRDVNDTAGQVGSVGCVMWAAELTHRGQQVTERLTQRRMCRRSRRQRHTRYRPSRFQNRRRREGWLPPSLESRIQNILTWVRRLQRYAPIGAISQELVRFDLQGLEHPEISRIEYQQGTLAGYEIRQYLLEKFHHTCVYCGATSVPLEVEHIIPRSRPGTSNRIGNLTIACHPCNQAKDQLTAAEFGHPEVQTLAARSLADAAAVNASRWALFRRLEVAGLPVETGSGGRTQWNRTIRELPKTHWLDAACVGASTPETLRVDGVRPLVIKAMGRHSRQMCRTNTAGFPDKAPKATSVVGGFRTGDIVRAVVPATSVKAGTCQGRIAVRATGSCNLTTTAGTLQGIHYRYCQPLHRGDGYSYTAPQKGDAALPPPA